MMSLRYSFVLLVVSLIASTSFRCDAASKHLLQAGNRTSTELPPNIRIDPPFPSDSPDDCADRCRDTEGCRGYRWRGMECSLTIQITPGQDTPMPATSPPPAVSPVAEEAVDPQGSLTPATAIEEPENETTDPTAVMPEPTTEVPTTPEPEMEPDVDGDGLPTTEEEIQDFLIDCQDSGSLSAAGAALAACSVIINRCPIPEEPEEPSFEPVALSDGLVPPARDALNMSLTEACQVLAIETCKNEAFNQAQVLNPECHRVLDIGPGMEDVAEGCENVQAANILFNEEVGKICETSPPNDDADG